MNNDAFSHLSQWYLLSPSRISLLKYLCMPSWIDRIGVVDPNSPEFWIQMMSFALNMKSFAFKMMKFAFKMMDFVLKMTIHSRMARSKH